MQVGKETVRLSPSIAKILLDKSPKHAWQAHRLLGGESKKPSAAQVKGHAIDKLAFQVGTEPVKFDYKLSEKVYDEAQIVAGHIKDALLVRGIFGHPQYRLEWTSNGVDCSGVVDLWDSVSWKFYELKTTHDLSDYNITKQIELYRYNLQMAAYSQGLYKINPTSVAPEGIFIFAETAAPYDVRFVKMSQRMLDDGRDDWDRAGTIWADCIAKNEWPGRGDFVADISPYKLKQQAEEFMESE